MLWLRRLAVAFAAALAGLVVAEFALRALAPQARVTSNLEWVQDPAVGFRLAPLRWVRGRDGGPINSLGLRGPEVGPRGPGEQRILVLGDSFVYGAGVAESEAFPAVLGSLGPIDRRLRVVNGGTPSYGTERQARWLEAFGDQVAPTRVLLSVFVGNDFTDNLEPEGPDVFDGALVDRRVARQSNWRLWLLRWRSMSHLWRLVNRESLAPVPAPAPAAADPTEEQLRRFDAWREQAEAAFARQQGARLLVYVPKERQPEHVGIAYQVMEQSLERIRRWCEARGVPLFLVILPDVVQVEERQRQRTVELAGVPPDYPEWDRPQKALLAWAEGAGIPAVDLLPSFRERGSKGGEESLYLLADSHFNARGHRLAAEVLAAKLPGLLE